MTTFTTVTLIFWGGANILYLEWGTGYSVPVCQNSPCLCISLCKLHFNTNMCVCVYVYPPHHTHTHCTTTALATSGSLPQPLPRSSSSRPCPHARCPAESQCSGQQDLKACQVWDSSTRAAWRARACGSSSQSTAHLASPPAAHASQCCSHILALPQTHQASLLWPFSLPEMLLPQRAAFLTSIRPRRLP